MLWLSNLGFLCLVHNAHSVGKIQVSMCKRVKGKWTSLGQSLEAHNTFLLKKDRGRSSTFNTFIRFTRTVRQSCWHL